MCSGVIIRSPRVATTREIWMLGWRMADGCLVVLFFSSAHAVSAPAIAFPSTLHPIAAIAN